MSATLGNHPLSTIFDANEESSRLSLDWVLRTGIKTTHASVSAILTIPGVEPCSTFSTQIVLPVSSSLPVDLVLGQDWMHYCQENFPAASFNLSSGVIQLEHLGHHSETPQLNQLPAFNCDAQTPADGSDSPIHLAKAAGSSVPLADVRAASSEAIRAGISPERVLNDTEYQEYSLVLNLKRKRVLAPGDPRAAKQPQTSVESHEADTSFPVILSQEEKDQIIREFRESTSNSALKRYECSFCGKLELAASVVMKSVDDLDISLLNQAVDKLRKTSSQPCIESFRRSSLIHDRNYVLCHLCNLSVSNNKFKTLPVRSYANGLWIGDVPEELMGLTFLEEQCIARARATKCMYKIHLGPGGQLAARGNVCILLQDTSSFVSAMPVPLFKL
ncbi:hypothetical protein DFH08DRAFT_974152 [Mycena albidolilacea]|uniref:DUF6570 domain-containing protein n=1 Tax=Mycena albidolilacea TaxID=1033008 RepID=A0AAD6Z7R0_9AGAR|nr:hypothetical protein DFH08DRAFT_974152 [Mycena albidolilacea]